MFQTNSNKQKQKLPYIVTIIDTIKTFYLLFSLISSFSFYRANYSHAMDLDLESRKKDHSTSTYHCNPSRDVKPVPRVSTFIAIVIVEYAEGLFLQAPLAS